MNKSDSLFIMALLCVILSYVGESELFWAIMAVINLFFAIIIFVFEVFNNKNK
jgi:ABC-type bacteriocin/lantibiotic exporter with double-glycine peptidase domain